MGNHVAMAIAQWVPAPEGASWAAIDHAWRVLAAMVDGAAYLDRGGCS